MFTKHSLAAAAVGATAVLSLATLAPVAQAASLTAGQISAITNLLNAFGADPATVANVQSVLEGNAPIASASASSTAPQASPTGVANASPCSVLGGNLGVGSEGEDVTRLQQFLSKDKSIYPQGLVTGYFGPATEDAVQRWQAAHNVVATGTPAENGFGVIGPRTRGEMNKEMEMECEGGDSNQSSDSNASSTASHEGEGSSASTTASHDN